MRPGSHRSCRRAAAVLLVCLGPAPARAYDWLQFGGDPQHSGNNRAERIISPANVGRLALVFNVQLPVSSFADGSPAYLSDVPTATGPRDVLFVTLLTGALAALDARTGELLWLKQAPGVAPSTKSCPAVDPNRLYVYGWGLDGYVHRYDVRDGSEPPGAGWPALVTLKPSLEQASSCLAIATGRSGTSTLYAETSSFGDAGNYQGHVTAIDLGTGAQRIFNALCSDLSAHLDASGTPPAGCADTGAGAWAHSGPVYDPLLDRIFTTTGNGAFRPAGPSPGWGETVLELAPDGTGLGAAPLDSYTPANWATLNTGDLDLGSTTIAILPPLPPAGGTPLSRPAAAVGHNHLGLQGGKDGVLKLLDLSNLSGTGRAGATGGELQRIETPGLQPILTAPAVWTNPADQGVFAFVANATGLFAYHLGRESSGSPSLSLAWQNARPGTSPLVANGILYVAWSSRLTAFDPATGAVLWETTDIPDLHMQSPIVVNGALYLTDKSGNVYAYAVDGELPGETYVVPSAAHVPGPGTAFWTTDLTAANTGEAESRMTLKFVGHDLDGTAAPTVSLLLEPGQTATYPDVLGTLFDAKTDYGAILVTSTRPTLAIVARTYIETLGGTVGEAASAVPFGDLLSQGASHSIVGVREDAGFRTNLILASDSGTPVTVDVKAVGPDGTVLATSSYTLPPFGMTQVPQVLRNLGLAGEIPAARLVLSTSSPGSFAAYASLIDNATNAPSFLLPR